MFKAQIFKGKKNIIYLIIGLIVLILLVVGFFVLQTKKNKKTEIPITKEKTMEEIINSLTAPTSAENNKTPEKVIESISAPEKKSSETLEDVIQSLTAPNK